MRRIDPIHPGAILREEFLEPMGISASSLAADIGIPAKQVNEIIRGRRAVTAETSLRLSRFFGISERFWLNLQSLYELQLAKHELGNRLRKEVKVKRRPSMPTS
jgi:addiction module HigA family antidote